MEIKQHSTRGKSVCIELRSGYVVLVDAGYYEPFKNNQALLPKENILAHLKEHFPKAGLDLIDVIKLDNFVVGKYQLEVSAIKSIYWGEHENEVFDDSKGYFGIDTGTLLVIDYEDFEQSTQLIHDNLEEFEYDYEKIVALLNQHIGNPSFAIIQSPGLDSDYEFVGDGRYFMDKKAFTKAEA